MSEKLKRERNRLVISFIIFVLLMVIERLYGAVGMSPGDKEQETV